MHHLMWPTIEFFLSTITIEISPHNGSSKCHYTRKRFTYPIVLLVACLTYFWSNLTLHYSMKTEVIIWLIWSPRQLSMGFINIRTNAMKRKRVIALLITSPPFLDKFIEANLHSWLGSISCRNVVECQQIGLSQTYWTIYLLIWNCKLPWHMTQCT